MSDNKELIKKCEQEISLLKQMTPINPDDLDMSWCDKKTRETIMSIVNDDYYRWKNRINQLTLILNKLKQGDGDSDV